MPLHKGAKPGSKKFGENVATEVKAGKPTKQAVAIAYSEARRGKDKKPRVSKDAKGHVHVFLPNSVNYCGLARTLARGFADRKPRRRAKDMPKENFAELKRLLVEFLGEEENEPEHAKDAGGCGCAKDCSCGCNAKNASPKKDCSCGCKH